MSDRQEFFHQRLACGAELAVERLPARRMASFDIRFLTGMIHEPPDLLGLAYITEQTITKGTAQRTGQQLSDAFDLIGAQESTYVGRESFGMRVVCLPEFLPRVMELAVETLRTPSFPDDMCRISIDLARQELTAIEDDPDELCRRILVRQAYGDVLGRHPLGNAQTLDRINREQVLGFWRDNFSAHRMQISLAGPIEPKSVADQFDRAFDKFGQPSSGNGRPVPIDFKAIRTHQFKELEQEQIGICWPGVGVTHKDYAVQRIVLAILSEGMSSRLFVEVREKLGLVYWVGAWAESPRSGGMIFMGSSTTPARCDETFRVMLREVDRLAEDVTDDELRRAKTGLIAKSETHGDITRARCGELASDLFYYGRPMPIAEKNAMVEAVSAEDIRRYLSEYPRDRLSVVTLGPRELGA